MPEASLKIIADAGDYLKQVNQISESTQDMSDTVKANYEDQAQAIKTTTDQLSKLQVKQQGYIDQQIERRKTLLRLMRESRDVEDIKIYSKGVDDATKKIKELEKSGVSAAEATSKLTKQQGIFANYTPLITTRLRRMILSLGLTTVAFGVLKAIVTSSERAMDFFRKGVAQGASVLREIGKAIASGNFKDFAKNLIDAARGAKELFENQKLLVALQNQAVAVTAKLSTESVAYKKAMEDESLATDERIEAGERYFAIQAQIIEQSNTVRRQAFENASNALRQETKLTEDQLVALTENAKAIDDNKEALERYIKVQFLLRRYAYDTELVKEFREELEGIQITIGNAFTGTSLEDITNLYEVWIDSDKKRRAEFATTLGAFRQGEKEEIQSVDEREQKLKDIRDKAREEELKKTEEFFKALNKLRQDYEDARIDSLTGEDRVKAELEAQLKEIDAVEKHLRSLGTLNEEHQKWLSFLRKKASDDALVSIKLIHKEEQDAIVEQNRVTEDLAKERTQQELQLEIERAKRVSDLKKELRIGAFMLLEPDELKKAEFQLQLLQEDLEEAMTNMNNEFQRTGKSSEELVLQIKLIQQAIAGVNNQVDNLKEQEKFSIFKLLGIDESLTDAEKEAIKSALNEMVSTWVSVTDQIFSQRVADAQRTRELITDQIDFTNDALANEIELMKLGYANNVDAKQKELEALKKEREKAIKEEERAIKAQKALDTILQVSSLVTASANIFKSLSKAGPVGIIAAIATIATMFGAFAITKAKAASAVKLAEGGTGDSTGVITGKRHSQGGERFLDHVEVEGGERWGVLSRRASMKYGKVFDEMVTSLNRGKLPVVNNNVVIDTDKTVSRLVKVENELVKLNKYFSNKADVQDYGSFRVEKSGHTTRIIRKNV